MRWLIFLYCLLSFFCFVSCNTNHYYKDESKKKISDEQLIKVNKYLVEKDSELIEAYIKRRNWEMKTTGSGLWYMIYEKGGGNQAQQGKYAEIDYTIELLDGTICYDSDSLGSKKFKIGKGSVESGLEEGILLLREGDKARFIMPPHLAHHLLGDEERIPARATIVYHIELLKISDN